LNSAKSPLGDLGAKRLFGVDSTLNLELFFLYTATQFLNSFNFFIIVYFHMLKILEDFTKDIEIIILATKPSGKFNRLSEEDNTKDQNYVLNMGRK